MCDPTEVERPDVGGRLHKELIMITCTHKQVSHTALEKFYRIFNRHTHKYAASESVEIQQKD